MRRRLVFVLLALGMMSSAGAVNRESGVEDPDGEWKNYLKKDTAVQPAYTFPHATCFRAAASATDLPETLLLAVARGESDFEETARSKANAHGVMQIQWPGTAKHLGVHRLTDLYDPCTNIDAGARYLKELVERYDGNVHLALAAYNYGPSRISAHGDSIPQGAEWYSGYIFRHLGYVLGDKSKTRHAVSETMYSELGRTTLLTFGEPYRAAAFVQGLEQRSPDMQLDWFRKGVGKFEVVLLYDGKEEFQAHAAVLASAGFPLN